ncbi:MAG: cation transporter [Methanobacteriales archaeon Met13]
MHTARNGLLEENAEQRLKEFGPNELVKKKGITTPGLFLKQFNSFLIFVLFGAAAISGIAGKMFHLKVILFIILFIAILGFVQEYKAEKAMQALKGMIREESVVLRGGRPKKVPVKGIVKGDIVVLEAGDNVPADAKVIESISLKLDESALTGESVSIDKKHGDVIFAGTHLVHGRCRAVVFATGMDREIGRIAGMISEDEEKTPLQIRVNRLAKVLALAVVVICGAIFFIGIVKSAPIIHILITALALSVAGVPEGMPLALALTLAISMHRMAKHHSIVRKMSAVETLGSTTVICTDKTGTLTKNEMTVERIFTYENVIEVTGEGYTPDGMFTLDGSRINPQKNTTLLLLLKGAALCNNAHFEKKHGIVGDPTEGALLVMAAKARIQKDVLEETNPRIEELIFTTERKMMTTLHQTDNGIIAFSKGAPEIILNLCKFIQKQGKVSQIHEGDVKRIIEMNRSFADAALRVLAIAYKKDPLMEDAEDDLIFIGLMGMIDPPRSEVEEAVKQCEHAGIRTIMITGDNEHTASSIGKKIGLVKEKPILSMTGETVDKLSDEELVNAVKDVDIYSRAYPEHKLRIVRALKQRGEVVAMTGDGVNDAPALKNADIGIAMGVKGTDVAKGASDIVLTDDNFATIVEAIKDGRTIYENIRKFTSLMISINFTQVLVILIGILIFGFELLPLVALQILLLNAAMAELPSLTLGIDPARIDVMNKPPRDPKEKLLTKKLWVVIFGIALFMSIVCLFTFWIHLPDLTEARTMVLSTLTGFIIFNTFNFISLRDSVFKVGFFTNRWLFAAIGGTLLILLSVIYLPLMQVIFETSALKLIDWVMVLAVSSTILIVMEIVKFTYRASAGR